MILYTAAPCLHNVVLRPELHVGLVFCRQVIYHSSGDYSFSSPNSWPNGLASRRKFPKAELDRTRTEQRQTDSQVAKSRKFHAYHWLIRFYNNRLLAINLCRFALGGQTVKIFLRPNLSSTKFNTSRCRSNQTQIERKYKTCVDLRVRLARA